VTQNSAAHRVCEVEKRPLPAVVLPAGDARLWRGVKRTPLNDDDDDDLLIPIISNQKDDEKATTPV
jgi:hypothetical protein